MYLKKLTQLQSLDLSSCPKITDVGLSYIRGLTQLRSLNTQNCNRVTEIGRAYFPNLKPSFILKNARLDKINVLFSELEN